jgi:hypothetical protein
VVYVAEVLYLQVAQTLLLQASPDPGPEQDRIERLWQVVFRSHLYAPHDALHVVQGRDHDDRDVSQVGV